MYGQQAIDLEQFMPESLLIQDLATVSTKAISSVKYRYYEDFINQDPYQALNLSCFTQQNQVPEHVIGSEIQEFFRNLNIFVTGGTGFLGKVLIEKAIRSLPNLKHIYILIRPKRGKNSKERFEELMKDQVFLRMQTEVPHYLSKMTVVEGDISEPGLRLSAEDRQMLIDNVNVVFNSAADVRFVEPLKQAIRCNVLGTYEVLQLCKEMRDLQALVHVSTAFSHCVRHFIEEKNYTLHTNFKEVLTTLENVPESEMENMTKRIIQNWPNTYTFSKALCEQMINEEKGNISVCIVRPSVVLPTYKEPVRGWVDNLSGPVGLQLGVGLGILHTAVVDLEASADFVPVDFVANFLLAAAWTTGSESRKKEVTVYNFTATSVRPTCWKDMMHFLLEIKDIWPFHQAVWYTSYVNTSSSMFHFVHLVLHTVPGIILDKIAVMVGKKARLSNIYSKMYNMKTQMEYFANNTWRWQGDNVWKIWKEMREKDRQLFDFDLASIDFKEHLLVYKLGGRAFLLKEKMETLPAAVKNNNKLYWLHKALQLTLGYTVVKVMAILSHHIPI